MAEPFLAEIRLFGTLNVPSGWAACNGQLLPINQNQMLFALLGTTYGGNGTTNFALPDLRDRVPMHRSDPPPGDFRMGQSLNEQGQAHTLTLAELPQHTHLLVADSSGPASDGHVPAATRRLSRPAPGNLYAAPGNLTQMSSQAVASVGGGQPHPNMQPFLTLTFGIALQGVFPSQN